MTPLFDVSKMHVLVGWLPGGGISGAVGELRLGSQELTLWDATKVDAIQPAEVVKDQSLAAITECAKGVVDACGLRLFFLVDVCMIFADREMYLGAEDKWEW